MREWKVGYHKCGEGRIINGTERWEVAVSCVDGTNTIIQARRWRVSLFSFFSFLFLYLIFYIVFGAAGTGTGSCGPRRALATVIFLVSQAVS